MRSRVLAAVASTAIVVSACGGGSSSGGPQTEQGAMDAVANAQRALFSGDSGDVMNFLNADCRERVDEDEVKLLLAFAVGMLNETDIDLDDVEITTSIDDYDGDTAEVKVEYVMPDGSDGDDSLFFSDERIDVMYEDGKWVAEDCDFSDDSEQQADELAEELEAAGLTGTRDDPVPAGTAAPVGQGFTVSIDAVDPDAFAAVEAGGGWASEPEAGNQLVMVDVTVGYSGSEEPVDVGDVSFTAVGGTSGVGVDFYGCSGLDDELRSYDTALMNGGVASGAICGEVPSSDIAGMVLNVGANFSDNTVFFDPAVSAASPTAVTGASGPQPDGDLTDDRNAPIPVGTATDIGEGWTLTVNGVDPDAAGTLAANEFNDPAAPGSAYVLVDVSLQFDGEGSGTGTAADLHLVGDSNVAARAGCSVSWDGELDRFAEVFAGGTIQGELCFEVAAADVASAVLLAGAEWGEEPEVFALR